MYILSIYATSSSGYGLESKPTAGEPKNGLKVETAGYGSLWSTKKQQQAIAYGAKYGEAGGDHELFKNRIR
ncbi:hypothetical protein M8C21_003748 [Ambrosia artemisiifolia]|uniref:Uncharacterized protein n=1 Tax=Ambrosia artemisiifolia TaxID=4212 RepID=A0AAD5CQE6_AMBAR|nr:hypothetical protein M8C21_003748 [Ambrosia artemisiifolia]